MKKRPLRRTHITRVLGRKEEEMEENRETEAGKIALLGEDVELTGGREPKIPGELFWASGE